MANEMHNKRRDTINRLSQSIYSRAGLEKRFVKVVLEVLFQILPDFMPDVSHLPVCPKRQEIYVPKKITMSQSKNILAFIDSIKAENKGTYYIEKNIISKLNNIENTIGKRIENMDFGDLNGYFYYKVNEKHWKTASSFYNVFYIVKNYCKFLIGKGIIDKDPMQGVKRIKKSYFKPKSENQTIRAYEYSRVLKSPLVDDMSRVMWYVFISHPISLYEISKIKRADVHVESRRIEATGKNGKIKHILLSRNAVSALKRYLIKTSGSKSEYLFYNKFGNKLDIPKIGEKINEIDKLVFPNLKNRTLKDLRQASLTAQIESGMNLKFIQHQHKKSPKTLAKHIKASKIQKIKMFDEYRKYVKYLEKEGL